jgi:hypothetical protein
MSDAGRRRDFTTVETHFLEAGAEMDRAAEIEAAAAPVAIEAPRPWERLRAIALEPRGTIALGAGLLLLGVAALWDHPARPMPAPILAIASTAAPRSPDKVRGSSAPASAPVMAVDLARPVDVVAAPAERHARAAHHKPASGHHRR